MEQRTQKIQRAPALLLLAGMIAGLLLSRVCSPSQILTASIALLLAASSLVFAKRSKPNFWFASIFLASALGFCAYGTARLPEKPNPAYQQLPEREARLTLQVERVMQKSDRFGRTTGIAKVLQAPELSRMGSNSFVYFKISEADANPQIGRRSVFELTGILKPIFSNSKATDFEGYLNDSGTYYIFDRTSELHVIRESPPFMKFCQRMNAQLQDYLRLGNPADSSLSNIYIAMLLGQKAELSPEQKDRFRTTGTMHLFAISGLHIGVVAAVFAQILFFLRIPRSISPLIGLPMLYVYVEITGAAPSAVRAFLMVTFFWASFVIQRQRSPLAALAASACFVLLIQPNQLWQMGFQLSYIVVLSILLFGLPLHTKLWELLRPYKYVPENTLNIFQTSWRWISDKLLMLFAISFSAWLASAPLSAGFFDVIAPYSVLVNMALVKLAALVISGGVISLLFALATLVPVTGFLNHSAWVCISVMDRLVQLNTAMPGAVIDCSGFPKTISYLIVAGYLALLFVTSKRSRGLRFALPPIWVIGGLLAGLSRT